MITTNAQWGAVRPSGFRKKPRHLDVMRSQHGMATQQVIAGKERQQRDEETAFDRQTAQQDLAMQQAKYKQDNWYKSFKYYNGVFLGVTYESFKFL